MSGRGVLSGGGLSRRAVVGAGVWAAPVLVVSSAVPAFAAASDQRVVSVSVPGGQVPAAGAVTLTVIVTSPAGAGMAGEAVSLTGPSGSTFGVSAGVTDGSGEFSTTFDLGRAWASPGSTVVVSAVSGASVGEGTFTVLGSNLVASGTLYGSTPAQTEKVFPSPVVQAVAGGDSTTSFVVVLLSDGTVWARGNNSSGQLGDGTTASRSTWAKVPSLSGVTQIAAGWLFACALLSDGSVRAWGRNYDAELGSGTTSAYRATPAAVSGLSGVTQIAAGNNSGYALLSDGSVKAWGRNAEGQLGDGSTTVRTTPVVVSGLSGVSQIAGQVHSALALLSSGSVKAWGYNGSGNLGDGSTTNRATPVQVSGLTAGVTQVAAGGDSGYALLSDGSVKAWGLNDHGQLGDGSTTTQVWPVWVSYLSGAALIAAGLRSAYALRSDGSVKAWGRNTEGQLGDGSTTNRSAPVSMVVPAGHSVQKIGCGSDSYTSLLVIADGTVSVDVVESSVEAGTAGTVQASVVSGSAGVPGVGVSLMASGNAVLGASSGMTGVSGVFQTTVTPGVWTRPGRSLQVTASTDGGSASDSFVVVGSNVVAAGALYASTPAQTERVFPSPVVQAVAGGSTGAFALVLLADGTVWAKGSNTYGQLGDGTTTSRSTWAVVPGLSGVTQVAAGLEFVCAVLDDGSVKAWGHNNRGQLGDGSTTSSTSPVQVSGLMSGVTGIAAGEEAGYALLSDGSVRAWGYNANSQLGDGTATSRTTPVAVSGLSGVTQIAAGYASGYALLSTGSVRAWGLNVFGQLGDGSTTSKTTPVAVSGLSGVTQIAAADSAAYALLSSGAVRSWGRNNSGQLGDGSTTNRSTPVTVSGLSGVVQIAAGTASGYALLSDGSVRAWGANAAGQLGDGTTTQRATPVSVLVPAGHPVAHIGGGVAADVLCMVTGDGSVSVDVVESSIAAGVAGTVTAKVASGSVGVSGASVSLSATGNAVLGASSGVTGASGVFQTTVTPDVWTTPGSSVQVTAANDASSASDSFTVVGSNLVASGVSYASTPAQTERVFSSPVVQAVSGGDSTAPFALALLEDGTVWARGNNSSGQLGDGTTTSRTTWAKVSGLSGVTQIAAGYQMGYALLSNGSVMAWGGNAYGELGDGSTTGRATPVQVSGLTSGVVQIDTGDNTGYALLSSGSVKAWGYNGNGQLGDGSTTNRSTPVQVSGLTSGVSRIAGGAYSGYALLSSGSVKAWGYNGNGQLGDGSTTVRSTPVQVSGLSGVTGIAAGGFSAGALLSDGSVKAWGLNDNGQVGDGSTTPRATPVAVSGLTSGVAQVVLGRRSAYALLSDGSVKAWGRNTEGQLGDGSTTNRVAPVSVLVPAGRRVAQIGTGANSFTSFLVIGDWSVSVNVVETSITAGASGTVKATVSSGPVGVSGASVSLSATGNAVLGASSGVTGAVGVFQTTVTPDVWTLPGSNVQVTGWNEGSSSSDSFTVVGSNLAASGVLYGSTPVQTEKVFSSRVVQAVSGGDSTAPFVLVLLADGTVWAKGNNAVGQLGDGTTTSRTTWAKVSGLSGVTQIAAGYQMGYALLSNGSVKAWGLNAYGNLGDGSTTNRSTPVQVSGLTSGITQIAAGARTGYALLSDGSVKAWGYNGFGNLGDGSTTDRTTPVAVSSLTSGVTSISGGVHTGYALLSDGSVRAWGLNANGQVGDGSTTNRTTPVQVSGLTSGVAGIAGGGFSGYALLSDGSVRAWGLNDQGQVGDGTTTNRTTPVQVSGLTSGVSQLAAGRRAAYVLLSDGSAMAWGANADGDLGDGTTTNRTAPVSMLVPAGVTVQKICSGLAAYISFLVIG